MSLSTIPTLELVQELRRRGVEPVKVQADVDLPGLHLSPSRLLAGWRGQRVHLAAREMEFLLILAYAHPAAVSSSRLATEVYGYTDADTSNAARTYISMLRRRLPRLLPKRVRPGAGYFLDLGRGADA